MEDPSTHRITADESTVSVREDESSKAPGYWIHKSYKKSTAKPLYTRVQQDQEQGDLSCYQSYRFSQEIVLPTQEEMVHVCFMGDSHSRYGGKTVQQMGITPATLNISAVYIQVRFMADLLVNNAEVLKTLSTCDPIIMAIGQWDFSHQFGSAPDTFTIYESNVQHALDLLHEHVPHVPVLGRNIHFNGMGSRFSRCTPIDWRLGMIVHRVFDSWNGTNQFTYVDTNFVVEPMWDSAPDWGHLSKPVLRAETVFLLSEALKLPLPTNSSVQFD